MTRKDPHEIATILAAFYRAHPERWVRGRMGTMETKCCLMGGALDITNQNRVEACKFFQAFRKITGFPIMNFNDKIARGVNDIIDSLDKVEANTR